MSRPVTDDAPPAKITKPNQQVCQKPASDSLSKAPLFSQSELQSLLEAMRRASWMIYGKNQPTAYLDKTIWMQIANHLHSCGWPRRTWQQLKTKGREMVARIEKENKYPSEDVNSSPPANQTQPSPVNHPGAPKQTSSAQFMYTIPTCLDTPYTQSNSVAINASPHSTGMPTLVPAPSIQCAETYQKFPISRPMQMLNHMIQTLPDPIPTGPRISHVATVPNEPNPALEFTRHLLPYPYFSPTVDQLLCNKEQDNQAPLTTVQGNQPTLDLTNPMLPLTSSGPKIPSNSVALQYVPTTNSQGIGTSVSDVPAIQSLPLPLPPPKNDQFMFNLSCEQQMRMYTIKMEILQLKRAYWIRKLNSLS